MTFTGGRAYPDVDLKTNEPEEATDLLFFFLNCNEKNRKRSGKQKYEEFKRRVFFFKKSLSNYYCTDSRKLILNGATLYTHLQFLTSTCTVFRVMILFRILCCYA